MPYLRGDPMKCTGCRRCELHCALVRERVMNPKKARLRVIRGEPAIDQPEACKQCTDAPCVEACSSGAIMRNPKTGIVIVNEKKCTGCATCVEACPYGMIGIQPDRGKAIKCDLCRQCIPKCPTGALWVDETEWVAAENPPTKQ